MKKKKYNFLCKESWIRCEPIIRNVWGALEQNNEKEDKLFKFIN